MSSETIRFNVFKFFKDLQKAHTAQSINLVLSRNPIKEEHWEKTFGIKGASILAKKRNQARNAKRKKLEQKGLTPFAYNPNITMVEHVRDYFGLNYSAYKTLIKNGCSQCKRKKNIHLHHIIPKSQGGSNEVSNLISLCVNCHQRQHKHDISANTIRT